MTSEVDEVVDEVSAAAASRRLDALVVEHPELLGPSGQDNVKDWIAMLATREEELTMPKEPTTQVAFRLPDNLIKRLDRHVARMGSENPGLDFTRVDAVRSLLTRALDEVEARDKRKG